MKITDAGRAVARPDDRATDYKPVLTTAQFNDLVDHLHTTVGGMSSCDCTFTWTRQWLRGIGLEAGPVLAALEQAGAWCDCEVLSGADRSVVCEGT